MILAAPLKTCAPKPCSGWKWVRVRISSRGPAKSLAISSTLAPFAGPMPVSMTSAESSPRTIPIFGARGTRLSPTTKTPLAISLSALASTFGGGGVSSMGLFEFVVREGMGRQNAVAWGRGRFSGSKADFPAPRNAPGSIKNDDEHEKRESAVAQSCRRGEVNPVDRKAHLGLAQGFGQSRYGERADNRAGQAARSADHQHRDDEEGQVEIVGLDPNRAEKMREQHAGDAAQEGAEGEGDPAMAHDIDARGPRRDFILARGAQQQSGARFLIGEGDRNGDGGPDRRGPEANIVGQPHERVLTTGDRGPVAQPDINDDQNRERRNARGNAGEAHERKANESPDHSRARSTGERASGCGPMLLSQELRQIWQEHRLLARGHRQERGHIGGHRHEADLAKRDHPPIARQDIKANDAHQHDEGLRRAPLKNDRREGRGACDHNDERDEEDQGRETRCALPDRACHMRCRRLRDGKRPSGRTIRTSATARKTNASRNGRSASGSRA